MNRLHRGWKDERDFTPLPTLPFLRKDGSRETALQQVSFKYPECVWSRLPTCPLPCTRPQSVLMAGWTPLGNTSSTSVTCEKTDYWEVAQIRRRHFLLCTVPQRVVVAVMNRKRGLVPPGQRGQRESFCPGHVLLPQNEEFPENM